MSKDSIYIMNKGNIYVIKGINVLNLNFLN